MIGQIMKYKTLKILVVVELVNCIVYLASSAYVYFLKTGIKNKEAALGAALSCHNLLVALLMKITFFSIFPLGIAIVAVYVFYRCRKQSSET